MYGTQIPFDNAGSEITGLVGKIAAFTHVNGAATEPFFAFVESSTALTNAWRGAFWNSTAQVATASAMADNETITLLKPTWIFANTSGNLVVTYTNPTIAGTQPSSPATGDYWFDLSTTAWKTYNSVTWVTASATLIGVCAQDTAKTVAVRTFDPTVAVSDRNTMQLKVTSNTQVQACGPYAEVNVFSKANNFGPTRPIWDITANLESGVTETLSTTYYLYMKEAGAQVISDKAPIHRRELLGLYHPNEVWRCLGHVYNNASTNFETPVRSFMPKESETLFAGNQQAYNKLDQLAGFSVNVAFPTLSDRFKFDMTDPNALPSYTPTTGAWTPIATLSLTPGLWRMISAADITYSGTALTTTVCKMAIDPNTTPTTSIFGYNFVTGAAQQAVAGGITVVAGLRIPSFIVNVTTATTYKTSIRVDNNASSLTYVGSFVAERLDDTLGTPP